MTYPILVAVLTAGGVYLIMQRSLVRAVFGVGLLGHAANFAIIASGGTGSRGEPLPGRDINQTLADPLPQAFVLTAIVITFAVTIFVLGLAIVGHNDDTHRIPSTGEEHDS